MYKKMKEKYLQLYQKSKIRSWLLLFFIIILLLIAAWCLVSAKFLNHKSPSQSAQKVTVVAVIHAKKQLITGNIKAVGSLYSLQSVWVAPLIAGRITQINFQDGEVVKSGQLLFQLNDGVYRAQLTSDQAAYDLDEIKYERLKKVVGRGIVSKQDFDAAISKMKSDKAKVDMDTTKLNDTKLFAPFAGVLGAKKVSFGDYVGEGQKLVQLTDLRQLKVKYDVPEYYLNQLHLGQKVIITSQPLLQKKFTGKVVFISKNIDLDDRNIAIQATVDNPNYKLVPGLFVHVTQSLGQKQELVVPLDCLVPTIAGDKVYKIIKGKLVSQEVKVGFRDSKIAAIQSGLKVGDVIVRSPQEELKDGTQVKTNKNAS